MPTTAGTGSETTAVAVTHVVDQNVKAGVSHRLLRPTLGIVDPLNTLTAPPGGHRGRGRRHPDPRDRVLHDAPVQRAAKHHPPDRPAYIGANPASDVWCEKAIEYAARYLRRAVLNGMDVEARTHLALAANYAGIGFGNAGVHLPHARRVSDRRPGARLRAERLSAPGHPLVPHGMSVILTAPAAFRFTYPSAPERHLRAAELLGVPVADLDEADAARGAAPGAPRAHARRGDPQRPHRDRLHRGRLPALVDGTLQQPRLLASTPRNVGAPELDPILRDAMQYW